MMRSVVSLVVLGMMGASACDRKASETGQERVDSPDTAATGGQATTMPTATPANGFPPPPARRDELPAGIEVRALHTGEPFDLQRREAKTIPLLEASAGEQLCLEKLFEREERLMFRSGSDCKIRMDSEFSLLSIPNATTIAKFDRYESYSEPLGALRVEKDGTTAFVSLTDGSTAPAPSSDGSERYFFVQNRPEVMAFGTPEGQEGVYAFTFVEGLPKTVPPVSRIERRVPDTGSVRFDPDRSLYTYRDIQTDCFRAVVSPDGPGSAVCEARIPRSRLSLKHPIWTDHWLVLADPKGEQNLAINLYTKQEIDPGQGLCERPLNVLLPSMLDVPRMLLGCPDDEMPSRTAANFHLWTPHERYALPRGPWVPGQAHGNMVELTQSGTAVARWLDVRRARLLDPGDLRLAGDAVATRRTPAGIEVFLFADDELRVRKLGTVSCEEDLHFISDRGPVVIAVCGESATPSAEDRCPSGRVGTKVTRAFAWDLDRETAWSSRWPFVGTTESSLLLADSSFVQGPTPCGVKSIARTARSSER